MTLVCPEEYHVRPAVADTVLIPLLLVLAANHSSNASVLFMAACLKFQYYICIFKIYKYIYIFIFRVDI